MLCSPEFDLIARYFTVAPPLFPAIGVGDDAAVFPWPVARARAAATSSDVALAITTDTLVAGQHFLPDCNPHSLGWKALAVNLSDLAAMAAKPIAFLLALTLPETDEAWLAAFSAGLAECAQVHGVALIGGDTTRGPLAITITALGEVPWGQEVRRNRAQIGDDLWISGQPGRAALGLAIAQGRLPATLPGACQWQTALDRPEPRVALGLALRNLARAMLDISDGLSQDACHLVAHRPELAVVIDEKQLPLAPLLAGGASAPVARTAILSGGDDYELLFTAPPQARDAVVAASQTCATPVWRIGTIAARQSSSPLLLAQADGTLQPLSPRGWDPFRNNTAQES